MLVVGGLYQESSQFPREQKLRGSGGRAALYLAQAVKLTFWTCGKDETLAIFTKEAAGRKLEIPVKSAFSAQLSCFIYLHQAGRARIESPYLHEKPQHSKRLVDTPLADDVILKYGMLEGDVPTEGDYVVYDPQSSEPQFYSYNGSKAKKLAIVANEFEVRALMKDAKGKIYEVAQALMSKSGAKVVVVKDGPKGALLVYDNQTRWVPAYCSRNVRKIGSGDMFAAAFAYFWGVQKMPPRAAADLASMTTSRFAETGEEIFYHETVLRKATYYPVENKRQRVYIAGPFFDPAQKWLIDTIRQSLEELGAEYFSPFHDAGLADETFESQREVARVDLVELDNCSVVLAVADGSDVGTIFEIGYACAKKIPVVILNHRLPDYQLTMFKSTYRCLIVKDLATALYHATWGCQHGAWKAFHEAQVQSKKK